MNVKESAEKLMKLELNNTCVGYAEDFSGKYIMIDDSFYEDDIVEILKNKISDYNKIIEKLEEKELIEVTNIEELYRSVLDIETKLYKCLRLFPFDGKVKICEIHNIKPLEFSIINEEDFGYKINIK